MSGVVCLWGWDEGKIHKLLPWALAAKERCIVVFEQNPLELFRQIVPERVCFFHYDAATRDVVFRKAALQFVFLPFSFPGGEPAEELARFLQIQQEVLFLASDVADKGQKLVSNLHAHCQEKIFQGDALFGAFKNVPAIVCGSGASLNKAGSSFKAVKDQALIIGAGSGIESLKRFGITPHFGAQVDPESSHKYSKTDIPLFFQLRADPEVVKQFGGPHLFIAGSGSFPLENWLPGEISPFEGGWTVGTFSVALAYHLGCDPIIIAGMDFASESPSNGMVPVGKMFSKPDWILASKWLNQFAVDHPDRRFIKLKSPSLEMTAFEEIDSRELIFSTAGIIARAAAVLDSLPSVSLEKKWEEIEESLGRSFALLEKQIEEIGAYYPKDPRENPRCGEILRELEREIGYQQVLAPLWETWQYPVARHNTDGEPGLFLHKMLFLTSLKNVLPLHAAR